MTPPRELDDNMAEASATDAAMLFRIRSFCAGLPEVEEADLQGRTLFRVRRRRFAIFNGQASPARRRWQRFGRSLHFLAERDEGVTLQHDPRFEISPHHGSSGWMALRLDTSVVDWDEVTELLEAGYRRAASRSLIEMLDQSRDGT